jgi:RNA polymerase primary sigma factor
MKRRKDTLSELSAYRREIDGTPLLTADEEKALAHRIAAGDAGAKDHLIRANLRLVVNIARKYLGRGLDWPDLIQEGNVGLIRAAELFDPAFGTRFATYASYWLKESIKRALTNTSRPIRLPAYMEAILLKWRGQVDALREELGRAPSFTETADALGLPKKKRVMVRQALEARGLKFVTDDGEHGWSFADVIPDGRQPVEQAVENDEWLAELADRVGKLERREANVVRWRYGLDGDEPMTLKQIGERLGVTREWVRRIEHGAIGKLAVAFGLGKAASRRELADKQAGSFTLTNIGA